MKYLIFVLLSTVAFADSAPAVIDGVRIPFTESAEKATQSARMVPNVVPSSGGEVNGFRFVAINPNSFYSKLGLKPMDVITKIDDIAINSPTDAMEMYNKFKSGKYSDLYLIRDGKPVIMHFVASRKRK